MPEIEIDLANPPDGPHSFPHRCFTLSFRIRSVLAALEAPEPWDGEDHYLFRRYPAYLQLEKILVETKALFTSVSGSASPFVALLFRVMGDKVSLLSNPSWGQHFNADGWLDFVQPPPPGMNHLKDAQTRSEFLKEFEGYAKRLERLGAYTLHLTQSAGLNLPSEYRVNVDS